MRSYRGHQPGYFCRDGQSLVDSPGTTIARSSCLTPPNDPQAYGGADPLLAFSEICRADLDHVRRTGVTRTPITTFSALAAAASISVVLGIVEVIGLIGTMGMARGNTSRMVVPCLAVVSMSSLPYTPVAKRFHHPQSETWCSLALRLGTQEKSCGAFHDLRAPCRCPCPSRRPSTVCCRSSPVAWCAAVRMMMELLSDNRIRGVPDEVEQSEPQRRPGSR